MNENLNLIEILKDCPKGTKLYSIVHGDVKFEGFTGSVLCPIFIRIDDSRTESFSADGKMYYGCGECILFPSKDQRDWSKFSAPWYKKEKQGDLSQTNKRAWLYLVSDVLTWKDGIGQYLDDPRVQELAKRLCKKYAQKLYNPSILSNSSNTGKNEQKFDPKTLQPFDKILARNEHSANWNCDIFSSINDDELYKYNTISNYWKYCIPYNDDTKHLVGTREDAPEYYKYWKD